MNIDKYMDFGSFGMPELLIMAGLGLAVLLFGYRIKRIAFFIVWFILGFNLMAFFMPSINDMAPEIASNSLYQSLLPVAAGIILAMMGFSIEKLCVGGIAFALIMVIAIRYFGADMQILLIGGLIGVIFAGFAVMMMKPATIAATALAGAYAVTLAAIALAPNMDFQSAYWPMIIGLTVVGTIFQWLTTKRLS